MKRFAAPIRTRVFHDAHLFVLLLIFFIAVAFDPPWYLVAAWALTFCAVAFAQGTTFRFALQSLMLAFALSFSVWLLNVLYPDAHLSAAAVRLNAQNTALKIWSLTWVALLSSRMTHAHDLVAYALQRGQLSLTIAYASLVGLGSMLLLRAEMRRISLNAKLRGLSGRQRFLQWLPLLVFALRHAQRGAMSLRARGLLQHKSFYYDYQPTRIQKIRGVLLLLTFALITALCTYFSEQFPNLWHK